MLAVDVGNSHLTVTRLAGTEVRHHAQGSSRIPEQWQDLLRRALQEPVSAVVVGSVGAAGPEVAQWLRDQGTAVVTAFHAGDEMPVATNVREVATVGVDRLAGALGAFERQQGPVLVADVGTAVTVDWMDADRVFQGGSIVPGRALCLRALAEGTARLPAVPLWSDDRRRSLPGKDTREAIAHGLDRGLLALVEGLVAALRESAGVEVPLWVTGGDAGWFRARTSLEHRADAHLVARGLVLAARGAAGEGA